ncbi:MAG: gltX1 [Rickettsiaceae bacterium]|jgi:glutamyl-tRNA synthetase|nr:gltX1 [Rickettsiaceae bacterium]
MSIITRFAPSPTGMLHVGNIRTAIVNWLFTKKMNGKFMLRMDDTDLERSKEEYKQAIIEDLKWVGLDWDIFATQSERLGRYNKVKEELIASNRLYECYETPEELETKRKILVSSGRPPIYDRAALKLTSEQKQKYKDQGRKPHYRFLLNDEQITWHDMVKGEMKFDPANLSDPILVREDGSMTYMISSTIDDIDFAITHIIRGEDHVSNTAIQVQLFKALNSEPPKCGHLALIQSKDNKISKRVGGFDIRSLKGEGIEPLSLISFLSTLGTSKPITAFADKQEAIDSFDIKSFSLSPTNYSFEELERINQKIVSQYNFLEVRERLEALGCSGINEQFWLAIKANIHTLKEVITWWQICKNPAGLVQEDREFLMQAASLLPEGDINETTWSEWTKKVAEVTGKKGKELFMPLRLALTGMDHGPELKQILPLIGRDEIIRRLS